METNIIKTEREILALIAERLDLLRQVASIQAELKRRGVELLDTASGTSWSEAQT